MEIAAVVIIAVFLIGFFLMYQKMSSGKKDIGSQESILKLLNENFNARMKDITTQFNEQTKQLNARLRENTEVIQQSNKNIGERLDTAAKVVNHVTERLGKMEDATKRLYEVGKDISSLHDILKAPKLRGSLGEFFLGDLLQQYFPRDQYSMPYTFRSGNKVDAALHLADSRIVPIDAKFPLENFKKVIESKDDKERRQHQKVFAGDVKKHIDKIAAQYIVADEGTMDFALMYIPAENVYYEIIVKDEAEDSLSAYAFKKRVIPVSPNNLFVYIQTVLMGLRGMQIEKSAKEIQGNLVRLKGDFLKFGDDFDVLGTHIMHAEQKYDESKRRFEKIGQKLTNIGMISEKEEEKMLN